MPSSKDIQKAAKAIQSAWKKTKWHKQNWLDMSRTALHGRNEKWVDKSKYVNINWKYNKVPHSLRKGYTKYHKTKYGKFHKLPYTTRWRKYT